jgi:hypothetical protein
MVEYIYYNGIGSKKNGKHTIKQFLDIMNKKFNILCSDFLPYLDYKPCKKRAELAIKRMQSTDIKFRNNMNKKIKELSKKCIEYIKKTKTRKCNLEEYIEFCGAVKNSKK